MMINKIKYRIIIASMIFCCLGVALFYHFRSDIFTIPTEYYVLESDTSNVGKSSRHLIVLLSNAPHLEKNVKKCLEESFWRHISLDTLCLYTVYSVRYYRETKYLTRPRDERGYDLSETGVSDIFFQEAADGFCSWFILQYMKGYKPFVTMMSKEIEIEGRL